MADENKLISLEKLALYQEESEKFNDDKYVQKEPGMGLSQESFTTKEKQKLADLIAAGVGGGIQTQVDYEQNDSTQPDYIKNRPFYDTNVKSYYSQAENPEPVSFNIESLNSSFYKVSDLVLTKTAILEDTEILVNKEYFVLSEDNMFSDSEAGMFFSDGTYTMAFINKAGELKVSYAGNIISFTVKEPGIYYGRSLNAGVPEGRIIEVTSGCIKMLDEKYVPDSLKLAWIEPAEYSAKMDIHRFDPIYWDGDTSSKPQIQVTVDSTTLTYYQVSDKFISYDEILGACVGMMVDGELGEPLLLDSETLDFFVSKYSKDFFGGMYIISTSKPCRETVNIDGTDVDVAIEYPGTYFLKITPDVFGADGHISYFIGEIEKSAQDMDVVVPSDGDFIGFRYVCDKIPTKETLVGAKFCVLEADDGGCYFNNVTLTSELLDELYYDLGPVLGLDGVYGLMSEMPMALFVSKDNTKYTDPESGEEIIFDKAGTYLLYTESGSYKFIIEEVGFDDVIHKIDPKYLSYSGASTGTTASLSGVQVLASGLVGKLAADDDTIYIYSLTQAMATGDIHSMAYKQLSDKFILPLTINGVETSSWSTLNIITELAGDLYSVSVLSSVPVEAPGYSFKPGNRCLLFVYKDYSGSYKSELLYCIDENFDGANNSSLATVGAINDYLSNLGITRIDAEPKENSEAFMQSGGIYSALQKVESKITEVSANASAQSDMSEQDPSSPSYIKNKLVYDEPEFPNIYSSRWYVHSAYADQTLADGTVINTFYTKRAGLKELSLSTLSLTGVQDILNTLQNIKSTNDVLKDETFEVGSNGSSCYYIKGTKKFNIPLIYFTYSDVRINGSRVKEAGIYFIRWTEPSDNYTSEHSVLGMEFKTRPHKLPIEYLPVTDILSNIEVDLAEQNPDSSSYITNRLVYDEPVYENLYPGKTYTDIVETTSSYAKYLSDNSYISASYVFLGDPMAPINNKSYKELLASIKTLKITGIDLQNETFEIIEQSNYISYIQGTNLYTIPLLYLVSSGQKINGTTVQNYGLYAIKWSDDDGIHTVDTIEFKTKPHKLPNEYVNLDQNLIENSINPVTSKAVHEALVVYDEPLYTNLYPGQSYTTEYQVVAGANKTLGDGTSLRPHYKYIGYPSEEFLNRSDTECLELIKNIKISGKSFDSETFEVVDRDSTTPAHIKGTSQYTLPIVYLVNSITNVLIGTTSINAKKGFYVLCFTENGIEHQVDTIEFKTEPHKLPNEYLTIDETPVEDSSNPVASGAVYTALKDVQDNLQFDEAPTEGSDNLVKSGALHTAFADVQKSLEVDDTPTADSDKLVKSGGVHSVLTEIQTEVGKKALQADMTKAQTHIANLQTEVEKKANQANVYTKAEVDGKISGVYHYKGSVDYYADLPTEGNKIGDAYNIKNDSFDSEGKILARAGDNVVYYEVNVLSADENGDDLIVPIGFWDVLAGIVDLAPYALKSEVPTKLSQLLNDNNYLTITDKDLYIITEENKDDDIPEHFSVILDTTETDEYVDLSEYMRDIPVTENDNNKYLRVKDGKWTADSPKVVQYERQRLTLREKEQARKNIGASPVWTVTQEANELTSAGGIDENSIIIYETEEVLGAYVKVCNTVYTQDDLIGKSYKISVGDSTFAEGIIEDISPVTENGSFIAMLGDIEADSMTYIMNCLVIAEKDVGLAADGILLESAGTYLSCYETAATKISVSIPISSLINVPVDESYLNTLIPKTEKAMPNGLATLDEDGLVFREQLPKDLGEQADWNELDKTSLAYIKNKPFYSERFTDDILWDGLLTNAEGVPLVCSSEVDLQPLIGNRIEIVRYVKIADLQTYDQTRPVVANKDVDTLYWSDKDTSAAATVVLNDLEYAYDLGEDLISVYYKTADLDIGNNIPVIYFVEAATTKYDASLGPITFNAPGIYVLHQDSRAIKRIRWKINSFKTLAEQFIPDNIKVPKITEDDEGKVLMVVNGKAKWVSISI